jgi:hypothetical protein
MYTRKGSFALSVALAFFTLSQCQTTPAPKPMSVVLLGNSYTYYNSGLGQMLEHLAASPRSPVRLSTLELTMGGVSINYIWDMKKSINALPHGPCDVVVVQDTLNFSQDHPDMAEIFSKYAKTITAWATEHGARTVLLMEQVFMPLGRGELTLAERERIHEDLSKALGVDVAPIAVAWQKVREQKPELNLYAPDDLHPNITGSYLMGCVLYSTITKRSPVGLPYLAEGLNGVGEPPSKSLAAYLQEVAWEVCLGYPQAHVK